MCAPTLSRDAGPPSEEAPTDRSALSKNLGSDDRLGTAPTIDDSAAGDGGDPNTARPPVVAMCADDHRTGPNRAGGGVRDDDGGDFAVRNGGAFRKKDSIDGEPRRRRAIDGDAHGEDEDDFAARAALPTGRFPLPEEEDSKLSFRQPAAARRDCTDHSLRRVPKKSILKKDDSSCESSGSDRISVSFHSVEVREYDRTVGDHPSCRSGPPVSNASYVYRCLTRLSSQGFMKGLWY
jgi:hypothetical protein